MRIVQDLVDPAILYVYLSADAPARTVRLDEGTLVDVDAGGRLLGIEVIDWEPRVWPLDRIVAEFGLGSDQADVLRAWCPGLCRAGGTGR